MVRIERITPTEALTQIAGDRRLWEASGGKEGVEFPDSEDHYYLQCVGPHKEVMGNWIFYPADAQHSGVYRTHVNFLSKFWGKKHNYLTTEAGRTALKWMFENTDAQFIYGRVAHNRPQVQRYATRIGFELFRRDAKYEHFIIRKI